LKNNYNILKQAIASQSDSVLRDIGADMHVELLTQFLTRDTKFTELNNTNLFCTFIQAHVVFEHADADELASLWGTKERPSVIELAIRKGMRAYAMLPYVEKLNLNMAQQPKDIISSMIDMSAEDNGLQKMTEMMEVVINSICVDGTTENTVATTSENVKPETPTKIDDVDDRQFSHDNVKPHKVLQEVDSIQPEECMNLKSLCGLFKDAKENIDFEDMQKQMQTPEFKNMITTLSESEDIQNLLSGKGNMQQVMKNMMNTLGVADNVHSSVTTTQ
jgi:hypothetical protein